MRSTAKYTPSSLDLFTLEQAKVYLQAPVDVTDTDALIGEYIDQAKEWIERQTNRLVGVCAAEQVWEWGRAEYINNLDDFTVKLKYGVVTAVTAVYAYDNDSAAYVQLYSSTNPAISVSGITVYNTVGETPTSVQIKGVTPKYTKIKVQYTCGHSTAADIPKDLKQAARRIIWYWYNPGDDDQGQVLAEKMLKPHILGRYGH